MSKKVEITRDDYAIGDPSMYFQRLNSDGDAVGIMSTQFGKVEVRQIYFAKTSCTVFRVALNGREYSERHDAVYSDRYTKTLAKRFAARVAEEAGPSASELRLIDVIDDQYECIAGLERQINEAAKEVRLEKVSAAECLAKTINAQRKLNEAHRDCREALSLLFDSLWRGIDTGAELDRAQELAAKYLKPESDND